MGVAEREILVLTSHTPPMEIRRPAPWNPSADQAVRDAMNAALAGDFKALDRLEITYLNVLVRIGELAIRHRDGAPHSWCQAYVRGDLERESAPFVTAYLRSFGRRCEPALEWQLRTQCRKCAGLLRRLDCRICGGDWYVDDDDDHELVYTTTEGVLIEVDVFGMEIAR